MSDVIATILNLALFLIARLHWFDHMCLFISVLADNGFIWLYMAFEFFHTSIMVMSCIYLIRKYFWTFCSESLGQSLALTAKLWILKRRHMERSSKYCSRIYINNKFLSNNKCQLRNSSKMYRLSCAAQMIQNSCFSLPFGATCSYLYLSLYLFTLICLPCGATTS